MNQGDPGLRGVNPRGAARDVDGSSIKSEARPPLLPPTPRGARRSRGLRAPEPRSLPLGRRSQAARVAGAPEPRRPVSPEPAWTLRAARPSPWGRQPVPMRPLGTNLRAPRGLPTQRLTCTPHHPEASGLTASRPAGPWNPTSQSPPSRQPSTCRTSGRARCSTAATSTRAPRKVKRSRTRCCSPYTPGPSKFPRLPLPLSCFSTLGPSRISHGSLA